MLKFAANDTLDISWGAAPCTDDPVFNQALEVGFNGMMILFNIGS